MILETETGNRARPPFLSDWEQSEQRIFPPNVREAVEVGVGSVHGGSVSVSDCGNLCVCREIATRTGSFQPLQGLKHIGLLRHEKVSHRAFKPGSNVQGSLVDRHRMFEGPPARSNSDKGEKHDSAQTYRFGAFKALFPPGSGGFMETARRVIGVEQKIGVGDDHFAAALSAWSLSRNS